MPAKGRRLTYANVAATLALLLSVGGVSYAAVALPANSVGRAQLRFPLGTWSRVDQGVQRVAVRSCGPVVNGVAPPCVPPVATAVSSLTVKTHGRGRLAISGLLGLTLTTVPAGSEARVTVSGKLDGKALRGTTGITVAGSDTPPQRQLAFLSDAAVGPGTHRLTLEILASGPAGGEVRVSPASLTASALP